MITRRTLKHVAAALVLAALGYLLAREVQKNWAQVRSYRIVLSPGELAVAFLLSVGSFLLETRAWQRAVNGTLNRPEMSFGDSVATVNTSGLLKYLPGRVWTYGAQMVWLGKRGIPKGHVLYVNLACLLCSMLVSTLLGGAYLILYVAPPAWALPAWIGLVLAHAVGLFAGPRVLAALLGSLRAVIGREIVVAPTPPRLIAEIGLLYVASWGLMGAGGYYSGRGVGLPVTPHDVTAITASMSIAWIVGYLSALTPGGIGVREALMFVMLRRVSTPEAAVLLPLVSRLLYVLVEACLGALGLVIGMRRRLFGSASS